MTHEQLLEWAENVPMEELYNEIRRLTGLADLKFTKRVRDINGIIIIDFESQNLADQVGFLKLMFKEIKITNFNSRVFYKSNEEDAIPRYWGFAEFSYTHPSGGSNGCTFITFWYDDRKGWEFELEGKLEV